MKQCLCTQLWRNLLQHDSCFPACCKCWGAESARPPCNGSPSQTTQPGSMPMFNYEENLLSHESMHKIARGAHWMLCLQMWHTLPMTPVLPKAVHDMVRSVPLV